MSIDRRAVARYLSDAGWNHLDPPEPERPRRPEPSQCVDLKRLTALAKTCELCRLAEKRKSVVFGEGAEAATLMFIGEGPGADEDRSGRPFVGQAGQLLDQMIRALGLARDRVYITNIVKCRPPRNRDPRPDEVASCSAYLDRQIDLIQPGVLVTLGKPASQHILGSNDSMGSMRGRWGKHRGIDVLPLYHPAYLLRQPKEKAKAWADLKLLKKKLG